MAEIHNPTTFELIRTNNSHLEDHGTEIIENLQASESFTSLVAEENQKIPELRQQSPNGLSWPISGSVTIEVPAAIHEQGISTSAPETIYTHESTPRHLQGLNLHVLDTYELRNLDSDFVENKLESICENISDYDDFLHGGVRRRVNELGQVMPFMELRDVQEETYSPTEARPNLVTQLRHMFRVPHSGRLTDELSVRYPQIMQMKFSAFVCRFVAFLIDEDIFSIPPSMESACRSDILLTGLETLLGAERAVETAQYVQLLELKDQRSTRSFEDRASRLALSFYATLKPLLDLPVVPASSREDHFQRLRKIALLSLKLSAELRARKGTFSTFWPGFGDRFDPQRHVVYDRQVDDFEAMNNQTRCKQVVEYPLMFGITLRMAGHANEFVYAKAAVSLRMPYVEFVAEHDGPTFSPFPTPAQSRGDMKVSAE